MIKGAQGVKILAKGLEKAIAGLPMFVVHKEEELDLLRFATIRFPCIFCSEKKLRLS